MNLFKYSILFTLLACIGCGSTKTSTTLIMFTNEFNEPTKPTEILIYNKRIELPQKYSELGTIKFEGSPNIEDIKKTAAEKGSDALLLDGNNYILIKFENQPKEGKDEKKSI